MNNSGHIVSLNNPNAGLDLFYKSIGLHNDLFESNLKVNSFDSLKESSSKKIFKLEDSISFEMVM